MSISTFFQFVIGFFLGLALIIGGATGIGYYFLTKLSTEPPKPVFPEEKPKVAEDKKANTPVEKPQNQTKKESTEEELFAEKEIPSQTTLPPGAYRARVTWPQGLSLRKEPSLQAKRVGGVAYNTELIILGYSDDKKWQKVKLPKSETEAWVKAGNVRKIN